LLSPDNFFTFVCNSRTRGHSFKLFLPDSRVNCRQHFFAVRVLRIWNSLPEDVVSVAHLSLFISRLVRANLNQFLIGKMYRCSYVFCFYISGFTLLTAYLYFVLYYLAAFKRHYALL